MKRLVLLFVGLGVTLVFFAYGPITVNVSIDTPGDDTTDGSESLGDGVAIAATIAGGNGDNNLTGTEARDMLNGRGGQDTLHGRGGEDVMQGGEDRDTMYGDEDPDNINGAEGSDRLYGGSGDDVITALEGNDVVDCGPGEGDFVFLEGDDRVENCENRYRGWFVIQDTP